MCHDRICSMPNSDWDPLHWDRFHRICRSFEPSSSQHISHRITPCRLCIHIDLVNNLDSRHKRCRMRRNDSDLCLTRHKHPGHVSNPDNMSRNMPGRCTPDTDNHSQLSSHSCKCHCTDCRTCRNVHWNHKARMHHCSITLRPYNKCPRIRHNPAKKAEARHSRK